MKIAFIYKYFPSVGGVERVMTTLANEFIQKGHEVIIYSFQKKYDKPVYELNSHVRCKNLPNTRTINSNSNVEYLVSEISFEKIDILINHDSVSDTMNLCKLIGKRTQLKIFAIHHGQIYLTYPSVLSISKNFPQKNIRRLFPRLYWIYDRIHRFFHHRKNISIVDKYILLSDAFKNQLKTNRNHKKLVTIHNPLSYNEYFDMAKYSNKENLVIMVGRLAEPHKRYQMALKIWAKIESEPQFDSWKFEIIGEGEAKEDIERTIANLNLKRVRLMGLADSKPFYQRAKIYFMTSAFEGFPLVLLEAMQNACVPIVMDSFETIHDVIDPPNNGIIIPNNDVEEFIRAVKNLIIHPSILQNMAEAALDSCHKFAPDILADRWIKLFNDKL